MQDIYIQFKDSTDKAVEGSSTDELHPKWIEVLNFNHAFTQPTSPVRSTAGGGTVERANHGELSFNKHSDKSSASLLKGCWSGMHYKTVVIECMRSAKDGGGATARVKYLTITMESVVISNYSLSVGGGDIPSESLSLAYAKVKYEYVAQDPDKGEAVSGTFPASHDLTTNKVS